MFRFLKKTIIISLIPVLIIIAFDVWLRNQKLTYRAKYEELIKVKDKVQLLILGNSHANYGVDPNEFKPIYAYNLANVSQKIYFDKRITLKALSENQFTKLKYVMISVDYHSLYTSSQGERDVWSYFSLGIKYKDKNYFLPNLSPFIWGYKPKVSISFLKKKLLDKRAYLDAEAATDGKKKLKKGFLPLTGSPKSNFTSEKYKKKSESFLEPNKSERNEVISDLKSFITELKSRGIIPILITSPTYKEYNHFLNKNILDKNKKDILEICEEFNIEHWDYMTDIRFEREDFYNQDHLNYRGAIKFSQILDEKLNNAIKQGK